MSVSHGEQLALMRAGQGQRLLTYIFREFEFSNSFGSGTTALLVMWTITSFLFLNVIHSLNLRKWWYVKECSSRLRNHT